MSAPSIPLKKKNIFHCRKCLHCCKQAGYVYLIPDETVACASFLGLDAYDFVNRFCDLLDRRRLVFKKKPDESCIFLGKKGCSIYRVRPKQCRDFPGQWMTTKSLQYCAGLRAMSEI